MFEEEAEDSFNGKKVLYKSSTDKRSYIDGFKDGYNKANEWHKDLPTGDIKLAIIEVEDCGHLLCEYRKGVWYDNGSSAVCKDWITQNIKQWKEIILPKESE